MPKSPAVAPFALVALIVTAIVGFQGPATAAQRSFVASSGSDANPCTVTLPCRSFSAAMVPTDPGGEIVVLDSAGYGTVAIYKSVSILAPPGVYAGVSVMSGTGIAAGGPGFVARVRGLTINGLGGVGGIEVVGGGTLYVEDCTVSNLSGFGVRVIGASTAHISRSRFAGFTNTLSPAIEAAHGATVTVNDTEISRAGIALHATSSAPGTTTTLRVYNSVVQESSTGIRVYSGMDTADIRLVAANNSISGGQFGIDVNCSCSAIGTIEALVAGNTVAGMLSLGIGTSGTGATIVATRNNVSGNGTGLSGFTSNLISLQDNVAERNLVDAQFVTTRTYH